MGQPGRGSRPGWRELAAASCPPGCVLLRGPQLPSPRRGLLLRPSRGPPDAQRSPHPGDGATALALSPGTCYAGTCSSAGERNGPGRASRRPRGPRIGDSERRRLFGVGVLSETPGGLAGGHAGLERVPALSASPDATCHFVGCCKVEPTTG